MPKTSKPGRQNGRTPPLHRMYAAIEFGYFDQAKRLLDDGLCLVDDSNTVRNEDDDLELTDPLARCCHRICYMAGDGATHDEVAAQLAIAHLLVDRGASLLRPDTTMDITPMEALIVLNPDYGVVLDQQCLQDIAMLWARMDENPAPEARGIEPKGRLMLERARKEIPGFGRVPGRLVDILDAVSQNAHMSTTVGPAGVSVPGAASPSKARL